MKRELFEVFKQEKISGFYVQMPRGIWHFKRKRDAVKFSEENLKLVA